MRPIPMPSRPVRAFSEGEDELSDDTPSPPIQHIAPPKTQKRPFDETAEGGKTPSIPEGRSARLAILHYKPETREFKRNSHDSRPGIPSATATEPLLPPLRRSRSAQVPPVKRFRAIRPRPPPPPQRDSPERPREPTPAAEPPPPSGPIVQRLRTGMPVPWSELSFWVPGWLDKPLQSLLCRRITKTGARLAYTMEEAHVILINPHVRYRPNYEPLHNLPSVTAGKALLEPYNWFLKCYYRGSVADESAASPVFVDEHQAALKVAVGAMRDEQDRLVLMIMLEENGAVVMSEHEADVIVLDWAHPFLREIPTGSRWAKKQWRSPAWVKDAIRYNTTSPDEQAIAKDQNVKVEPEEPVAGPSGARWDQDEDGEDDEDELSGSDDEDDESEPAEDSEGGAGPSRGGWDSGMAKPRAGPSWRTSADETTRGRPNGR